jgi:Phage capsid family
MLTGMKGIPLKPDRGAVTREQTRSLHRALTAVTLGRMRNKSATELAKASWPGDEAAQWLTRAPTVPLDRTQSPAITSVQLLPLVAPRSAASLLFERALRLDFAGISTISVPNAAEVSGAMFVAEGAPIPVSQGALVAAVIGPVRKLALICGISREVENASASNASAIIGRLMSQGASRALDRAVFSAAAATSDQPAGLLNGVTPIPASSLTGIDGMTADLVALVGAVAAANVIGEVVLVANPARALAMSLLSLGAQPHAVLASNQIPIDVVIAVGVDGVASGYDGVPEISASTTPAVHFADPALPISEGGVTASPVMSSFQQDTILLKLRALCSWGVTQPGSIQFVSGVKW